MAEISNPVGNTFSANVRVVAPPERRMAGDKPVLEFRVANKCVFKKDAPSLFFDITLWGEQDRERFGNLRKGEVISVSGVLAVREYQDKKTGEKKQRHYLDRAYVTRLERAPESQADGAGTASPAIEEDPLADVGG